MEKSQIQSVVGKFKDVGITCWGAFCRGGNYELRHNGKDTFNILSGDFLVHFKHSDCYENLSRNSQFEIDIVPYENIDYIYPLEINYLETKGFLKSLGVNDPAINEFLKRPDVRMPFNSNSRAMENGGVLDDKGNPTDKLFGKTAYIIGADADRRAEAANEKSNPTPTTTSKWYEIVEEK